MKSFNEFQLTESGKCATLSSMLNEAPMPGVNLYHAEIGFPTSVTPPPPGLRLTNSEHAKQAARDEGLTRLPKVLPSPVQLIEVEVLNGRVIKWLIRTPSQEKPGWDLVMAIKYDGFVKTVWLNHQQDKHKTLDRTKYAKP